MNHVWNVFLAIYRGNISDRTPGDAIRIPCNTYDADIRGGREVLDCVRSVSISTSAGECRTVQRAADGPPACVTKVNDRALLQRSIYLLGVKNGRPLAVIGQGQKLD